MAPFPSPIETTVASALLLLSTTITVPPSPQRDGFNGDHKFVRAGTESKSRREESSSSSLSLVSTGSRSCSSSITSDGSGTKQIIQAQKPRIVAVVSRSHELKLKVAKRKRSKICWSSDCHKAVLALPASTAEEEEEASCLSCNSSAVSRARSRYMTKGLEKINMMKSGDDQESKRRLQIAFGSLSSSHMKRRAEAILKLLSGGCGISEVRIRQMLGDSPDTSKALRMLLKQDDIKRSGKGGRSDPYIYMMA